MRKIIGSKDLFSPYKEEDALLVISFGLNKVNETNYSWYELYYFKKEGLPSFEKVKDDIIRCINDRVTDNITSGYKWTILHGEDAGKEITVWLSTENQMNFKAKHDAAKEYPNLVTWPMQYKVGELTERTEDPESPFIYKETKRPVYEYFENIEELAQFYLGGIAYIESCYQQGWAEKDAMDFSIYEDYFKPKNE